MKNEDYCNIRQLLVFNIFVVFLGKFFSDMLTWSEHGSPIKWDLPATILFAIECFLDFYMY